MAFVILGVVPWAIYVRARTETRYREKLVWDISSELIGQLAEHSRLDMRKVRLEGGRTLRSSRTVAVFQVNDMGQVGVKLKQTKAGWRVRIYRGDSARPCREFDLSKTGALRSR